MDGHLCENIPVDEVKITVSFKPEGDFLNCYILKGGDRPHDVLMGSARLSIFETPEALKDWRDYMTSLVKELVRVRTGAEVEPSGRRTKPPETAGHG